MVGLCRDVIFLPSGVKMLAGCRRQILARREAPESLVSSPYLSGFGGKGENEETKDSFIDHGERKTHSEVIRPLFEPWTILSKTMTASAEENGAETTNSVQNAQPSQTDELTKRSLDTSTDASPSPSIRQALGQKMHSFTEVVNENLIAARFGVFSGVCLLTAYSLANTPLFFRFRVVSEIPGNHQSSIVFAS